MLRSRPFVPFCLPMALALGACHAAPEVSPAAGDDGPAFKDDGTLEPRTGLPVGRAAPEAELRTGEGEPVKISGLIAESEGPVVLVFYRGGWCPYCVKHLSDLQAHIGELEELGASVIAVSPETPEHVAESIEKTGAEYTILSDPEMLASTAYNLTFEVDPGTQRKYRGYGIDLDTWNSTGEWKLPVPALYIIDKGGVIRWRHVDENYRERVKGRDVVEAVRALTEEG